MPTANARTHAVYMDIRQFVASHPAVVFPRGGWVRVTLEFGENRGDAHVFVAPNFTQR
jgi:hypothetical protein